MRRRLLLAILLLGTTSFAGASGCSDPTGACVVGDTCCSGKCLASQLIGDVCGTN